MEPEQDRDPLDLIEAEKLAGLLKVTKQWLYDEHAAGRIKGVRLGRRLNFTRQEAAAFVASHTD